MAKVHPSGLNNTASSSYSKKGYSILLNYFKNTNESLNKLKFVEDDSANESDIFTRGNEENGSNKYSDTNAKIVEKSVEGETMKQACQSGNLNRIKYLIETAKVDPNQPDEQNVFPLHWVAINNRIEVAEYLLEKGAKVDPIGGNLETTPLNWAISGGHLEMVKFLVQHGANSISFNNEGFAPIHIAIINGHFNIVAYFLANGMNPNLLDRRNASPLIIAAKNSYSNAMTQIFLTYNASVNLQDDDGNTALHYSMEIDNWPIVEILLKHGASADIKNNRGQTAIDTAYEYKNFEGADTIKSFVAESKLNKQVQIYVLFFYPFFMFLITGLTLESSTPYLFKLIVLAAIACTVPFVKKYFYGKRARIRVRFNGLLLSIIFCYMSFFTYTAPLLAGFNLYGFSIGVSSVFLFYYLYKAVYTEPGYLPTNCRDESHRNENVLSLIDKGHEFCAACIVRKPLRSKHCAVCNRCVSMLDHHCPWINNCVGENNVRYFALLIMWGTSIFFLYSVGVAIYFYRVCFASEYSRSSILAGTITYFTCAPWLNLVSIPVLVLFFWSLALIGVTLKQLLYLGLTTNEKINIEKYKYFKDEDGKFVNPYSFGLLQNTIDFFGVNFLCFRSTGIRWTKLFTMEEFTNFKTKFKMSKSKFQKFEV